MLANLFCSSSCCSADMGTTTATPDGVWCSGEVGRLLVTSSTGWGSACSLLTSDSFSFFDSPLINENLFFFFSSFSLAFLSCSSLSLASLSLASLSLSSLSLASFSLAFLSLSCLSHSSLSLCLSLAAASCFRSRTGCCPVCGAVGIPCTTLDITTRPGGAAARDGLPGSSLSSAICFSNCFFFWSMEGRLRNSTCFFEASSAFFCSLGS